MNRVLIFLLFVVLFFGYSGVYILSADTIEIVVTDKERITTGSVKNLKHKYLVYTEGEVFENTDSFSFFKWNSSDIHGYLVEGKTYKVKVAGWRVPFLSSYRNIVDVDGLNR
jgi:hypothetical protein